MTDPVPQGTWVEIEKVLLAPGERAEQVPEDTSRVALKMRVKGFLTGPATLGEQAEIVTAAGRHLQGILAEINPAYSHGFGPPIPELGTVGEEARSILRKRGHCK